MPVKKEASGRRSIQVEVEVPGAPEEVWEAIATGPGISCWFSPTEVETRKGGVIRCMGEEMTVVEWDPPHRYAADNHPPEGTPVWASEWIVEPRAGGKCVVRVVHSMFTEADDWDDQLESTESGWPVFFENLRLYLTRFRGETGAASQAFAKASGTTADAFQALLNGLGVAAGSGGGDEWEFPAGGLALEGVEGIVEQVAPDHPQPFVQLRLTGPTPGILSAHAFAMGDSVMASASLFFYGAEAGAAASSYGAPLQEWLAAQFA